MFVGHGTWAKVVSNTDYSEYLYHIGISFSNTAFHEQGREVRRRQKLDPAHKKMMR